MWAVLKNYTDAALLFLRVTLGAFFIYVHGWPRLAGGLARWKEIGQAMRHVGVTIAPGFWGFMAASAETLGCLLLIIGVCFRPASLWLAITMTVSAIAAYHTARGGFGTASEWIEMALVFFALMFIGPGRFSVDKG